MTPATERWGRLTVTQTRHTEDSGRGARGTAGTTEEARGEP